jgi:hypothetical protein
MIDPDWVYFTYICGCNIVMLLSCNNSSLSLCIVMHMCRKMPKKSRKSRAEIQREYRERRNADQVKREQYLKKEKDKYQRDLIDGKRKLVSAMSAREQRKTRKDWTKRQRLSRANKVTEELDSESVLSLATASFSNA